jgi:hypothetical protein
LEKLDFPKANNGKKINGKIIKPIENKIFLSKAFDICNADKI